MKSALAIFYSHEVNAKLFSDVFDQADLGKYTTLYHLKDVVFLFQILFMSQYQPALSKGTGFLFFVHHDLKSTMPSQLPLAPNLGGEQQRRPSPLCSAPSAHYFSHHYDNKSFNLRWARRIFESGLQSTLPLPGLWRPNPWDWLATWKQPCGTTNLSPMACVLLV